MGYNLLINGVVLGGITHLLPVKKHWWGLPIHMLAVFNLARFQELVMRWANWTNWSGESTPFPWNTLENEQLELPKMEIYLEVDLILIDFQIGCLTWFHVNFQGCVCFGFEYSWRFHNDLKLLIDP